jgi:hypothetical protein
VPSATTSVPATSSVGPANTFDVNKAITSVRARLNNRRFSEAIRDAVAASERAPDNAALAALLRDVLDGAAGTMTAARRDADRAGSSNRPVYAEAVTRAESAARSRQSSQFTRAVDEYVAATRLFVEASQVAAISTAPTTVVVRPPTTTSIVATVPTTVQTTIATTSSVTTTSTTSILPAIDMATVQRVLQQYAAASRTLDASTVRGIYPGLPPGTVRRIEALRKDYSFCEYAFSNVQILSNTPDEVRIRTDSVESCKPKTAQKPIEQRGRTEFILKKTSAGAWLVSEMFGQQ